MRSTSTSSSVCIGYLVNLKSEYLLIIKFGRSMSSVFDLLQDKVIHFVVL
jgi:hypothetical protein